MRTAPGPAVRWMLLLVPLLLAGCSTPPPKSYDRSQVELDVSVLPLTDQLLFRTATYNGLLVNLSPSVIRVEVHFAAPSRSLSSTFVGANESTLDLRARTIQHADLQTPFVGTGDYHWNVTIRDKDGVLVKNQSGLYETCFC